MFVTKIKSFLACGLAVVTLAGCQAGGGAEQLADTVLFAPTPNASRNVPATYGTPYDCRTFQGSGYKGIAGGKRQLFSQSWNVSRAGCFKTEQECQAFLVVMRQYIDIPGYIGCRPYTSSGRSRTI
ncbi:hypothetical protein JM93_00860 [Roseibium hamelinense]|uniref:Lipoprotein n=1 Tax=Roseibium hamelinense TaxID=150831 RepID=A0A562TIY5_9HYPH|nr:hypothetical protein [Roseibium hamelinense]MTI42678.1 hypothetical protein [Roseibium hamelinense]TWI93304.1 hypothetical protein JM93_00860 [Roseibium hamelinense]